MVIDDDEAVVRAIEQIGIPVTLARWMPEPKRQASARTAREKTPGT
jgi:hypothetical protein